MTFLSRSSGNRQWCHKWPISITTTITIFKKMHFSKIFPTKYFAVCFFEILEACCNLKQGSLVMSLPFFFWGVSDMGASEVNNFFYDISMVSTYFSLCFSQLCNSTVSYYLPYDDGLINWLHKIDVSFMIYQWSQLIQTYYYHDYKSMVPSYILYDNALKVHIKATNFLWYINGPNVFLLLCYPSI